MGAAQDSSPAGFPAQRCRKSVSGERLTGLRGIHCDACRARDSGFSRRYPMCLRQWQGVTIAQVPDAGNRRTQRP
jgi:hypothetical protein